MAKNISPEMLETILTKIMEKFTDIFKSLADQVVSAINNRVDLVESKFHELNTQIVVINSRLDELMKKPSSGNSTSPNSDMAIHALMAVELEREERIKRSCNVIITGIPAVEGIDDEDVFAGFCEDHLTIKPHPASVRRVGKSVAGNPVKLRITLGSSHAVDDLIAASSILRQSASAAAKGVYFNHDLTKIEAQAAFERRQKRRNAAHDSTSSPSTSTARA